MIIRQFKPLKEDLKNLSNLFEDWQKIKSQHPLSIARIWFIWAKYPKIIKIEGNFTMHNLIFNQAISCIGVEAQEKVAQLRLSEENTKSKEAIANQVNQIQKFFEEKPLHEALCIAQSGDKEKMNLFKRECLNNGFADENWGSLKITAIDGVTNELELTETKGPGKIEEGDSVWIMCVDSKNAGIVPLESAMV
jgi:hypothetical protein